MSVSARGRLSAVTGVLSGISCLLDVVGLPAAVDPGLERAVETDQRKPTDVPRRADPVALLALWRLRADVDGDAAVLVELKALRVGIEARERLAVGEHRARPEVVDDN